MADTEKEKDKAELQEKEEEQIRESGQLLLDENEKKKRIHLMSIIGDDCFFKQTDRVISAWREPLDRGPNSDLRGLFLYCAEWDDGDSSSTHEWHYNRCTTDIRLF